MKAFLGVVAGPLPAVVFTLADAVYGWCRWQTLQLSVRTRATAESQTQQCQALWVPPFPGGSIVGLSQGVCGVQIAPRAVESWIMRYQGSPVIPHGTIIT